MPVLSGTGTGTLRSTSSSEGWHKRISNEKEAIMATTPRRPTNPKDAAEALFKPAKKVAAAAVERPAIPNTKELVSLKLDSDVLAFFQSDGPGWQDRINDTLRATMKQSADRS